jgi:hypothetical protein
MSARAPGFPINDSTAVEITVYRGSLSAGHRSRISGSVPLAAREHFSDRLVPEDEVDRLHGHARPVGDLLQTGLAPHDFGADACVGADRRRLPRIRPQPMVTVSLFAFTGR